MKVRGDSALSLGEKLKVAHTTVGRWLAGSPPGSDRIEEIARALSVSAQWLLTGEGDGPDHVVREQSGNYGVSPAEAEVLRILRGGPAEAAKKMSSEELITLIKEHTQQAESGPEYMRGAHAEIIAALSLELNNRSKPKQEEQK
jgi:transcriptional regulator with XRE-family HTH domain